MALLLEKLNEAFVADPSIDEYALVPAATQQLFSPSGQEQQDVGCIHAEHKLAISIEAALILYLHAYQVTKQSAKGGYQATPADADLAERIRKSSRAVLLCSADCTSAWSAWNRMRVLTGSHDAKADLLFSALLLRTNHKSGETWAQRRKLLASALQTSKDDQQALLTEEISLLEELARRYDHHYYAWNHWAWLNRYATSLSTHAEWLLEVKFPMLAFKTPSHYGLFHHRLVRLQRLLEKNQHGIEASCFKEEWDLAGKLLAAFPHLEAPWAFRAQLVSLKLEHGKGLHDAASVWRSEVAGAARHMESPPTSRLAMQFQVHVLQELCLYMLEVPAPDQDLALQDEARSLLEKLKASKAASTAVLRGIAAVWGPVHEPSHSSRPWIVSSGGSKSRDACLTPVSLTNLEQFCVLNPAINWSSSNPLKDLDAAAASAKAEALCAKCMLERRKLVVDENLKFKCEENRRYYEEDEVEEEGELDEQLVYEGDEWVFRMEMPAIFHRFIVGSRARNKQKLEMESGCKIVVPKREEMEDAVYLRARQKSSIYSCKALIELLCEKEEAKLEYTHFISVPLAYDDKFRQLVDGFREDVVLQRFQGIDASIFMPSQRMHFTLCMLKLHSHAQVDEMKEALKDLSARLSATSDYARPVLAHMKGLHIFTDDPTSVGVIFTTDRSRELQNRMNSMADSMFELFQARNLVSAQNLMSQRLLSSDGQHAEVKLHATLMNTKYARSRFDDRAAPRENFDASVLMERFGPCIDIHSGQVKQIVGGTLKDDSESLVTNFSASQPSGWFAEKYRSDGLGGGHAIMLGASDANKAAALEALKAYPGGLQVGGGINAENAMEYIEAGASHVIVTSYVFHDGKVDKERLAALVEKVGKARLVLDLSCRRLPEEDKAKKPVYKVVTDRWQKWTDLEVTEETLRELAEHCSEFLVHGVDVEGLQSGIEEPLVQVLAASPIPVTYAGGVRSLEDMERIRELGNGRVDATIGSALDIFGGKLPYEEVLRWHRKQQQAKDEPGKEA
ncbi:HISN3 [Symbiodinium pilosum]|uniref:1-(5-phosphoribosyl)-5-[(5-phosphoribosylamino)methylideneamino]imidazole-4-carboxamideisomerase n=1 Tax=Symbiodinium pilosum TaxID=2952 RepID=A0A812S298_SYMPI|nr:HISN3 [Symbiodinium pilosum]